MAFVVRCHSCGHKTPYQASTGFPDACGGCGTVWPKRADDDIVMPFIRSPKTHRTDQLFRDMERGSEQRAQIAAEMTGAPVSEMSALKVTNMADNLREGDIAAPPPPAPEGLGGFQGMGREFAAATADGSVVVNGQVTQGIAPRAGASAIANVRQVMGQGGIWPVAPMANSR